MSTKATNIIKGESNIELESLPDLTILCKKLMKDLLLIPDTSPIMIPECFDSFEVTPTCITFGNSKYNPEKDDFDYIEEKVLISVNDQDPISKYLKTISANKLFNAIPKCRIVDIPTKDSMSYHKKIIAAIGQDNYSESSVVYRRDIRYLHDCPEAKADPRPNAEKFISTKYMNEVADWITYQLLRNDADKALYNTETNLLSLYNNETGLYRNTGLYLYSWRPTGKPKKNEEFKFSDLQLNLYTGVPDRTNQDPRNLNVNIEKQVYKHYSIPRTIDDTIWLNTDLMSKILLSKSNSITLIEDCHVQDVIKSIPEILNYIVNILVLGSEVKNSVQTVNPGIQITYIEDQKSYTRNKKVLEDIEFTLIIVENLSEFNYNFIVDELVNKKVILLDKFDINNTGTKLSNIYNILKDPYKVQYFSNRLEIIGSLFREIHLDLSNLQLRDVLTNEEKFNYYYNQLYSSQKLKKYIEDIFLPTEKPIDKKDNVVQLEFYDNKITKKLQIDNITVNTVDKIYKPNIKDILLFIECYSLEQPIIPLFKNENSEKFGFVTLKDNFVLKYIIRDYKEEQFREIILKPVIDYNRNLEIIKTAKDKRVSEKPNVVICNNLADAKLYLNGLATIGISNIIVDQYCNFLYQEFKGRKAIFNQFKRVEIKRKFNQNEVLNFIEAEPKSILTLVNPTTPILEGVIDIYNTIRELDEGVKSVIPNYLPSSISDIIIVKDGEYLNTIEEIKRTRLRFEKIVERYYSNITGFTEETKTDYYFNIITLY